MVKVNAEKARATLEQLRTELKLIDREYNQSIAQQLKVENGKLEKAINVTKTALIQLEQRNGIKQVPITVVVPKKSEIKQPVKKAVVVVPQPTIHDHPDNIGRLDLRVGRITQVQHHPNADTLYQLTIDVGETQPRTVCSGLVNHIHKSRLENRLVMVLCNLKPVKMRGIISEAMVMCASDDNNHVEVLSPPSTAFPGDPVICPGYSRNPDVVMNPKKKIFESVAPDLLTNNQLDVCYKGTPLVVVVGGNDKGPIRAESLKNVNVK